ncbi:TPA: class I SAM-dependent methyltransferase [Legionella pneumophila]
MGIISHQIKEDLALDIIADRLKRTSSLVLPIDEELAFLQQLSEFELGRFLLANRGLNGFWTSYLIAKGWQEVIEHPLERWMLYQAPGVRATQERFAIFQSQLKKYIQKKQRIASIPCGLMDDLLTLPVDLIGETELWGVDLDELSLEEASMRARLRHGLKCHFHKNDAWQLPFREKFHLITSNGLNIYERHEERVIALYQEFNKILKSSGVFITSFLTPPEYWVSCNERDLLRQKAIWSDIIQVNWQCFRTEDETRMQLGQAGFYINEVIYDTQHMFPTVVAIKTT